MGMLPDEVAAMFTQDYRFRQETFNDMRIAFDQVSKNVDGKTVVEVQQLRAKLDMNSRKDLIR